MKTNTRYITRYCLILWFLLSQFSSNAQSLGLNITGASANPSSMLDIDVTGINPSRGLLIPRVTSAKRAAMNPLPAAAQGLLVYQTDGTEGFYYNTSTTVTPAWVYIAAGSGGWLLSGNSLTGATPASPNEWLGSSNDYDWVVKTNNTERLRIISAGKVGINNASPFATLDVLGQGFTSATGSLNVANGLIQPILYARDDQRVGIKTAVPNSTLTVAGDVDFTGARLHVDASTNKVGINNASPFATLDVLGQGFTSATGSLNVANGLIQPILYARDDQRVGIATAVPNSTLSIAGSESHAVTTQSASYSLTATDYCVIFTSGTNTCTLPAAAGITGRVYILVNHSTVALTTSIAFTTANGVTSTSIAPGNAVQLISDGTVWRKIN